jgi:hypothetical protein
MELLLQVIELCDWQEHPNDRLTCGMIIRACPNCHNRRKVDSCYRAKGDNIAIHYVFCKECKERIPHEADDRDAVVLKPV